MGRCEKESAVLLVLDQAQADLGGPELRCPDCPGRLPRWGFARPRSLRSSGGGRVWLRPRRVRCASCRVSPGEHLVIDWGSQGGVHVFCAVLAWSRWRFVRFASDEKSTTTLAMLGECFAEMGGVPQVVLADRMGCLKGGVVANRVVPTGDYVRFALHYPFSA